MAEISTNTPDAAQPQWLHAGPIRVKFADGELRYLSVGDKEIVRRIYFAVRDEKWDTAMPRFATMAVASTADTFNIKMTAICKMKAVDYAWSGSIIGSADGKISFTATGSPNADFDSNRIGLCVLFGTDSLIGQGFATDGKPAAGEFPRLVSSSLVATQFRSLQYTTAPGLHVSCQVDGATFDMEDQRNWGDSSWKAYAPLPYEYKHVKSGDSRSQTVTIAVDGKVDAKALVANPVHVKTGAATEGARVPDLVVPPAEKLEDFPNVSFNREKFNGKVVAWSYIPTTHLPDEDTIFENLTAVRDQARTVRSFNADCKMQVGPIGLSPSGSKDSRANSPMAADWAMGMVKSLALGGVDQASFALGDGLPAEALNAMRPYAGKNLLTVETLPAQSDRLIAWAAGNEKGVGLFLANRSDEALTVEVETSHKPVELTRIPAKAVTLPSAPGDQGVLKLQLDPHEMVRITIGK